MRIQRIIQNIWQNNENRNNLSTVKIREISRVLVMGGGRRGESRENIEFLPMQNVAYLGAYCLRAGCFGAPCPPTFILFKMEFFFSTVDQETRISFANNHKGGDFRDELCLLVISTLKAMGSG